LTAAVIATISPRLAAFATAAEQSAGIAGAGVDKVKRRVI
jgi:hypothetical protein